MYDRKKNMYYSVNGRNVYMITKVISIPILLAISALAMVHSSGVQVGYSQSQGLPLNRQQETTDPPFQTIDVTLDGANYPVKYNITDDAAEILSMVADKESFKLIITIAPTNDGKLTVMMPRNLTDYKVAGGKDGKFVVNINAKQITDFQEISNNQTTRGLEINFGKDDRVIEVTGTQMGQADISNVREQTMEAAPAAGTNASETGGSIVN